MNTDHVHYDQLKLRDSNFENPRQHSGLEEPEIRELALLIANHGILTPLRVTQDHVILAGQRRYLAIAYIVAHAAEVAEHVELAMEDLLLRMHTLIKAVPVIYDDERDPDGVAMADNLGRVDLSSYEIAAEIDRWSRRGDTGADIAKKIGKSPAYVSKALKAWRTAGHELKETWRTGAISYDQVKQLADLQEEEQERAIAGGKTRGGHGRPGIDAVKDTIGEISKHYEGRAAERSYAMGVLDALRWVSGQTSSTAFAEFMEAVDR